MMDLWVLWKSGYAGRDSNLENASTPINLQRFRGIELEGGLSDRLLLLIDDDGGASRLIMGEEARAPARGFF